MISMIAFWTQGIQILTVYSKQVQAAIKNINVNMGVFSSGDLFLCHCRLLAYPKIDM